MPIYSMACMRDRTEPLDEPERTDADWMEDCKHCAACERLYVTLVDGREFFGWKDAMAEKLGCTNCEEWDG